MPACCRGYSRRSICSTSPIRRTTGTADLSGSRHFGFTSSSANTDAAARLQHPKINLDGSRDRNWLAVSHGWPEGPLVDRCKGILVESEPESGQDGRIVLHAVGADLDIDDNGPREFRDARRISVLRVDLR